MNPIPLTVEVRTQHGKQAAKGLRRQAQIPAVLYGEGVQPMSLAVSPDALTKALDNPFRRNSVFSLTVDGKAHSCIVRELQVHPVTRRPLHVDFYSVPEGKVLEFKIPLKITGRSVGVQKGGFLSTPHRALKVACPITAIPEVLELDISALDINQNATVGQLPALEGVKVLEREGMILAAILSAQEEVAEAAAPAEAAAAPAAAPAAAAPAKK